MQHNSTALVPSQSFTCFRAAGDKDTGGSPFPGQVPRMTPHPVRSSFKIADYRNDTHLASNVGTVRSVLPAGLPPFNISFPFVNTAGKSKEGFARRETSRSVWIESRSHQRKNGGWGR